MKRSIDEVLGKETNKTANIEGNGILKQTKKDAKLRSQSCWNQGLLFAMKDPQQKIHETSRLVVIKDKYPKAKFHFLILPWTEINDLHSLTRDHVELLMLMHEEGERQAARLKEQFPSITCKLGYHAIPSMSHLHMHVISEDFVSPCLKTKKHWNSFNSQFFKTSEDVIKELKTNGKLTIDRAFYEKILKTELRCHRCPVKFSNMPKLKDHLLSHVSV